MNRNFYYSVIISLSSFCCTLHSAIPIEIKKQVLQASKLRFVDGSSMDLRQLKSLEIHRDFKNTVHQRLQQFYENTPIWDAYLMTHRQSSQTIAQGLIYQNLAEDLGEKPADLISATRRVLASIKKQYDHYRVSDESIVPIIYVDATHTAHWAYEVNFLAEKDDNIPLKPHLIIDKATLKPYLSWNDIKTLDKAKGQGFGGNIRTRKVQYGLGKKPFIEILRDPIRETCLMQNTHVTVLNMHSLYSGGQIPTFECNGIQQAYWTGINQDGYDEINEAYSPTNDALFIGTIVHDMYRNWYQVNALGSIEKPRMLTMRVHYGRGYENAFWDGRSMTFGDGGNRMYPLTVLTVGAHEISHGFTDQYANLAYVDQSGGMNEAFSDMAAQAAEYYVDRTNSWTIGAEVMKEHLNIPALRYMDNPARDGKSIEHVNQYYSGIDVHYLSGVYNRFFYLLATSPGWNTRRAFQVMVKANMDYWVPTTNFSSGACGVLWAAEDLDMPLGEIEQAFHQVGIETAQC